MTGPAKWLFGAMIAAVTMISAFLIVGKARAEQQSCAPFKMVRENLEKKHNETIISGGLNSDKLATFVFASPGGETFTIVIVDTRGIACQVGAGKQWFQESVPVPGDDV